MQKRSIERVNNMLLQAEHLLLEAGVKGVTIHKIAARCGVSAASVYQYFPTVSVLLSTLAENKMKQGLVLANNEKAKRSLKHWRDVIDLFVDASFQFYCQDQVGNALFLTHGFEEGVKEQTCTRATRLGLYFVDILQNIYAPEQLVGLEEKLANFHEAQKSIYRRCITLHGKLKVEYKEEVRALAQGYIAPVFEKSTYSS